MTNTEQKNQPSERELNIKLLNAYAVILKGISRDAQGVIDTELYEVLTDKIKELLKLL